MRVISPQSLFKHRTGVQTRTVFIFLLVLITVVITTITTIIITGISNSASRDLGLSYSTEAAARFYSYINKDLVQVQNMSRSKAVIAWFTGEQDQDKRAAAYEDMMGSTGTLNNSRLCFSIDKSLNEYLVYNGTTLKELIPSAKLDWSDPVDRWYFDCVNAKNEYTLSVGSIKNSSERLLWISHKVMDGANIAGAIGSGISVQNLFDDIFINYDNKNIRGYVIDSRGLIQMDSASSSFYTKENNTNIHTISSAPGFNALINSFLDTINNSSDSKIPPKVIKLARGVYKYASIAPIADTGWSVVILIRGSLAAGIFNFMPLLLTLIAAFVLYVIVSSVLVNRSIFLPLHRLTESVPENVSDKTDIFGHNRGDEIGDLARKILKMTDHINEFRIESDHRSVLMRALNDAAIVLLSVATETKFEASLLGTMKSMGRSFDIDRIYFCRNEVIDGALYFNYLYQWFSNTGQEKKSVQAGARFSYDNIINWEEILTRGENVNGPLSGFQKNEQDFFRPYEVKSILIIPIHTENHFWGFVSFHDCRNERCFTQDEVNMLDSACLMMVNAVNRNEQATKINEAHQRTKMIMDAMPLCTTLWDRNFRPFDCNEETLKLFKLTGKQEFLGRFFDFSPEYQSDGQLSKEKIFTNLKKAFDGGKWVFEWLYQLPDGTPIPAEITLVRVNYDEGYAVAAYIRDLREQKQMMEGIEHRDRLLHAVNETATILLQSEMEEMGHNLPYCMGMLGEAVGVDRVYLWRNHTRNGELYCTQLYEWSGNAEPLQNTEFTQDVSYNERFPEWKETLIKGNCVNDLVQNLSPETQSQLNPQGILSILLVPVFLNGEFWGFLGFDDCHNERVFSENAVLILRSASLLIANILLHNQKTTNIRSSAIQLEAALKEAKTASEAKTSFLASMSHEIRSPLNAIIGLSQVIMESGNLNEESGENIKKIFDAGITLLDIANDILDISKIEAGKFELLPVEYDMPSLINNVVTQSIMRKKDKPVKFILNITKDLPESLYGDDLRIRQILNNLLSNAFKYTKEGEVEFGIRCTREDSTVWVTAWVRDTGLGIRPENMKSLFVDYVELDTMINRGIEGTGLGLPIAKKLVELMGGTITVESEYGRGSVFAVKFKQVYVNDNTIGSRTAENLKGLHYSDSRSFRIKQPKRISLPYARILMVDDIPTNLDVAKGMMKPYDMQIDCVASGQEAIDAIRDEKVKYDAVFMDHMMPVMDGVETTKFIREKIGTEYAKTIPIIALTANALVGNEEMFLSNGFQAFLPKPLEMTRLDKTINKWVRNKEKEKVFAEKQINAGGEMLPDIRTGKERRAKSSRRSGIDRRMINWKMDGVDVKRGVQQFNGVDAYLEILHSYVSNIKPLLAAIKEVNRDNLPDYITTVHGIKGSSAGICADAVAVSAELLEKAGRNGDLDFVNTNNPPFLLGVEKLIADIEETLKKMAVMKYRPKKTEPDREVLLNLLTACKNYRMDEVDAAMKEIESFEYETGEELTEWLRENIEHANFVQIKEKLSAIIDAE